MPCEAKARIVSHAVPSPSPLYPKQARAFARFNDCARLNLRLSNKIGPEPVANEPGVEDLEDESAQTKIVARILAVSRHASQGVRVLTTSLEASGAASCMMLDLARSLARKGRSIAISLDTSALPDFAGGAAGPPAWNTPGTEPALGELLVGTVSFSEVIRRDSASRLHYLSIRKKREIDLHEFTAVLDALGAIYGFIVMIAPPASENETAKMVAATTDVAVLAVLTEPGGAAFEAERQLIEGGAREVLLVALAPSTRVGWARDVA
jgi:polysaccharide biosynthesis transport protein